jgi:hypothetical protein
LTTLRRPIKANEGPQKPTKAYESQRRPTQANESPRKPMRANDGPTRAHESQRRPTKANAGQRGAKGRRRGRGLEIRHISTPWYVSSFIFNTLITFFFILDYNYVKQANEGPRKPTKANAGQRRYVSSFFFNTLITFF